MTCKTFRKSSLVLVLVLLVAMVSTVAPTAQHALAAPALSVAPKAAPPGGHVTIAGFGFHAGDTVLVNSAFKVNGSQQQVQAFALVGNGGNFAAAIVVPQGSAPGIAKITAIDFHNDVASTDLTVLPQAYLQVNAAGNTIYVTTQEIFAVRGVGFKPGERVSVSASFPLYSGDTGVAQGLAIADGSGNFSQLLLRVPRGARAGAVPLTARGESSGRTARSRIIVVYRSTITLDPLAIRPGGSTTVNGKNFVPGSTVTLSVTIARNGNTSITSNKTASVDGNGNFSTAITLPSDVSVGRYTIYARDAANGAHPSAVVNVTTQPVIAIDPAVALPGEPVTVSGAGYGYYVTVNVRADVALQAGGTQRIGGSVTTNGKGAFTTKLFVPRLAGTSTVTVVAGSKNGQASNRFQVRRPAPPKPRPTSTPLPAPTMTATPLPNATATDTPTPVRHRSSFKFQYVSLWYHTVRLGTYDHLTVQGRPHTQLGIWVHVYFPNGQRLDFYENTDDHGYWERQFNIPRNAATANNNQAVVTVRLWSGGKHRDTYVNFNLVP